jgi:hypothetical protein
MEFFLPLVQDATNQLSGSYAEPVRQYFSVFLTYFQPQSQTPQQVITISSDAQTTATTTKNSLSDHDFVGLSDSVLNQKWPAMKKIQSLALFSFSPFSQSFVR